MLHSLHISWFCIYRLHGFCSLLQACSITFLQFCVQIMDDSCFYFQVIILQKLHYAIKQYFLPMGPRIVRKLFFRCSDNFLFFLPNTFSLPFLRLKLSCCSLLRSPDISHKNFSSQYKRSLWNKLFYFLSKDIQNFIFQTYFSMMIKTLIYLCYGTAGTKFIYKGISLSIFPIHAITTAATFLTAKF